MLTISKVVDKVRMYNEMKRTIGPCPLVYMSFVVLVTLFFNELAVHTGG